MTAPTVEQIAEVLREHQVHSIGPACTCGWRVSAAASSLYRHQAEQVAALGGTVREDEGGEGRG